MRVAFVDIIYDHFLANDPYEFEEGALADFAQNTYMRLDLYSKGIAGKIPAVLLLYAHAKLVIKLPFHRGHSQQFQGSLPSGQIYT